MADEPTPTPPVTPVTAQPAPETTPPPAPAAPPAPEQPHVPAPSLDVTQAAETFTALNKLFEEGDKPPAPAAATPPTEGAPSTTPAGQAPAGDKPPERTPVGTDLQKTLDAITAPVGAHPNVGKGIDELKRIATEQGGKVTTYENQLKELQTKLQAFETAQKEAKLPEPIEKELTELRSFRREVDMRQDPEFQNSYIKPVQQAETEMMGMLQQVGLTDETIKYIQDNGGIIAISQSQEKANDKQTMADWLESSILGRINTIARNRIMGKLASATDLIDKGQRELADWRENGQQRYEARMKKITEEFNSGRDEAIVALGDLVKPKVVDASDSAEVRTEKEAHNNLLREAEGRYAELLKISQQPKVAGSMVVKATQADMLLKMYTGEKAKVADLQARLDRIKASGSHSVAGDHTPPPGPEKPSMTDLLKKPTEQALTDLFNQAGITR